MPAPAYLQDIGGNALHTEKVGAHTHLVVEDHSRVATQFKAQTIVAASTAIIVTPPAGAAIVITDIIVSAEKVSSGSITVQFDDGTNAVIIFRAIVTDAPVNLHIPFAGRWRGWKDARIDMVGAGVNIESDVSVGYYILRGEGVLPFAEWDAQRG